MNCKQVLNIIRNLPECSIRIMLPDGTFVPEHFHITEIGRMDKRFIDCGGIQRESHSCVLQVWVAHDIEHRLDRIKLINILSLSEKLYAETAPLEVEYGIDLISQYTVKDVEYTEHNELLFVLGGKRTECLAPNKCGVNCC